MNPATLTESLPARPAPRFAALRVVAAKEWLELRRAPRGRLLVVLTAILMLLAALGGVLQFVRSDHERHAAQDADRQLWTKQGEKDPHSAAHFGQWAFKPPSLLALADPGIDAYSGSAVWMEAHKRNEMQFRSARDGGVTARMGGLTLAFVLQAVLPLLVIVLGFNAVSGERESGTLRQLLGQGTRPAALLAGKALALLRGVAWLLGPLALGLAAFGALMAEPGEAGQAVLRALAWTAAHGLYLAGFVVMTIAVSALAGSSRAALVTLVALWLLASFVAPRVMTEVARSALPLPTAQEFRQAVATERSKTFGHDETHPAFAAYRDELLKQYGVQRVEDLPLNFRGLALRKDDELGYVIYDRMFGDLNARIARQDALRQAPGFVLPLLAAQPLSMALAGTDAAHHRHFAEAAEAHRRVIQTMTSEDLIRNQRFGDTSYVAGEDLWARVPPFDYRPPSATWAIATAWPSWLLLAGWLGLTSVLGALAARRLQPI
ncbi:MAG TPA: DUF3526 domain-containing protein [Rubrivivax sp.]|nr:DUF3526 domain-containing protein [Rubrivivax sp.]